MLPQELVYSPLSKPHSTWVYFCKYKFLLFDKFYFDHVLIYTGYNIEILTPTTATITTKNRTLGQGRPTKQTIIQQNNDETLCSLDKSERNPSLYSLPYESCWYEWVEWRIHFVDYICLCISYLFYLRQIKLNKYCFCTVLLFNFCYFFSQFLLFNLFSFNCSIWS